MFSKPYRCTWNGCLEPFSSGAHHGRTRGGFSKVVTEGKEGYEEREKGPEEGQQAVRGGRADDAQRAMNTAREERRLRRKKKRHPGISRFITSSPMKLKQA